MINDYYYSEKYKNTKEQKRYHFIGTCKYAQEKKKKIPKLNN